MYVTYTHSLARLPVSWARGMLSGQSRVWWCAHLAVLGAVGDALALGALQHRVERLAAVRVVA